MTKHVLDRPRSASKPRAEAYADAARRDGPHPATTALLKRPRTEGPARTRAFLKIARTGTAEG